MRSKGLPTIHNDFKVLLKTEDDYIPERQIYLGMDGLRVQPMVELYPSDKIEALLASNNEIVLKIKEKLLKLALGVSQRTTLTRQLVSGYVVGRDELEKLNEKFPSKYRSVVKLKSATESQLAIRTLSCSDNHGKILKVILTEYEDKLNADFSGTLSSALISRLSTEAISDWLGRCPLDFHKSRCSNESN